MGVIDLVQQCNMQHATCNMPHLGHGPERLCGVVGVGVDDSALLGLLLDPLAQGNASDAPDASDLDVVPRLLLLGERGLRRHLVGGEDASGLRGGEGGHSITWNIMA